MLVALYWFLRDAGRCAIFTTALFALLAFVTSGIAAGGVTAIVVKGVDVINKYGDGLGIVAYRGNKFLGITWAATACAFIAMIFATAGICCGARGRGERRVKRTTV